MFLSVFDIFKVGVGPSSSHTMGPMVAAGRFLDALRAGADRIPGSGAPARLGCRLHGSLAFTGKGHATDRAVILGLAGFDAGELRRRPRRRGAWRRSPRPARSRRRACRSSPSTRSATSSSTTGRRCPATPTAWCSRPGTPPATCTCAETYYSIGGGFVLTARELERPPRGDDGPPVPYPFALRGRARGDGRGDRARHRRPAAGERAGAPQRRRARRRARAGSGR